MSFFVIFDTSLSFLSSFVMPGSMSRKLLTFALVAVGLVHASLDPVQEVLDTKAVAAAGSKVQAAYFTNW